MCGLMEMLYDGSFDLLRRIYDTSSYAGDWYYSFATWHWVIAFIMLILAATGIILFNYGVLSWG
jgi:hypothetical protein